VLTNAVLMKMAVADSWQIGAVCVQDQEWKPTMVKCRNRGEEKITLTLKIGSVYHVINSTCIHLRVNSPNIYICTGGEEYTKNPIKKYNNKKC
jgi:hypothetical protein